MGKRRSTSTDVSNYLLRSYSQHMLPSRTISTGCFLPWNQSSKIQRMNKSDGFSRKHTPPLFPEVKVVIHPNKYKRVNLPPATRNQSPAATEIHNKFIKLASIKKFFFSHNDLYPDQQVLNLEAI